MVNEIGLYEALINESQSKSPDLIPLVSNNSRPEWRECQHLIEIYQTKKYLDFTYCGVLSPKFSLKTGFKADVFSDLLSQAPNVDVLIVNPFPQLSILTYNVWTQGESFHPGITKAAQSLLDGASIDFQIGSVERMGPEILSYCNFWMAKSDFWTDYCGNWLDPIWHYLLELERDAPNHPIFQKTYHVSGDSMLVSYVIERMFSTFLVARKGVYKVQAKQFDLDTILEDYCLDSNERRIVMEQLKRSAGAGANSFELATNLYASNIMDNYKSSSHPHS